MLFSAPSWKRISGRLPGQRNAQTPFHPKRRPTKLRWDTMIKRLAVITGVLPLGICIGAVAPRLLIHHHDISWLPLKTDSKNFGTTYSTSVVFPDLPLPNIKSIVGRVKFINHAGPGQTTEFGYIISVDMDALDMSKIPQRYKQKKKAIVEGAEGIETTRPPLDRTYYEIDFDFDLKDEDGFSLKTLHGEGLPSLESGTDKLFQARVG
jgi:hypothetical protein